jgi:hypothetical protein
MMVRVRLTEAAQSTFPLTPASAKLAMPVWQAKADLSSGMAKAAPDPSPRRMPRSKSGLLWIAANSRRWPGSAER